MTDLNYAAPAPAGGGNFSLDVSGVEPIPFTRLVRLELRKMVDTRAGLWLMISTALICLAVVVIALLVGWRTHSQLSFDNFMFAVSIPMSIFLPVLGIMAVTAEFTQRTALVSFTQTPSRMRLIWAKFAASVCVALVAVALGMVIAAASAIVSGWIAGDPTEWGFRSGQILGYFLGDLLAMATGFAFGTLFINTAVSIVLYFVYIFVLPPIFGLAMMLEWFRKLSPWIDFNSAQLPLLQWQMSGSDWAHLAVSGSIWLLLPLVLGMWRVSRAEIK